MAKIDFIPLQPGKLCPFNGNDWETLKNQQNCQDPEFYHCIPDQYNVPGQICVKPNWASKNYCPIFNTAANDMDLIPCDLQYGTCPDKDYRSNLVYQYAGCLNKTQMIGRTTTDSAEVESSNQLNIIIPAVVAPLVLLLTITGVVLYWYRSKGAKYDANDIELQPLLHENRIPWSFLKTINYLDNKVFYSTKSYSDAVGILSTYHHTTLIGPPGSGKTSIAVQLARLRCGKKDKSQIFFCNTLEEIIALSEKDIVPMYIIMDDWLNHYAYYPSQITEDEHLFDQIFDDFIKYKKAEIILTVQEDIWFAYKSHLSEHTLFRSESCVSINKSFDEKEVHHMVINHLKYWETKKSSINTEDNSQEETLAKKEMDEKIQTIKKAIKSDLKSEKEFCLPVMIDLICANTSLMPSSTVIIRDGFSKILRTFLRDWMTDESEDEKNSFCIFMFAALRGGKVMLEDFTSEVIRPIYENVCNVFRSRCLEHTESIEGLLRRNQRLKSCLYQENDLFIFHHGSVLCFVLQFLIKTKNAEFLIKNVNMEILVKRCWIKESIATKFIDAVKGVMPDEPVGAVFIPIDALKDIAKRIHEEISKGYAIPDWSKHVFMEHKTFSKMWKDLLTEPVVARPDPSKTILPASDENQMELYDECRSKDRPEESTQNVEEKDAESKAGSQDLNLSGAEKKSKQTKHKEKKIKDQISTGKKESNSEKPDCKEEDKQSNVEQSPQINVSPDSITINLPGNDEHAENGKHIGKKTKKNKDKVFMDKKQTKPKKGALEKNDETPQQSKVPPDSAAGDTPV